MLANENCYATPSIYTKDLTKQVSRKVLVFVLDLIHALLWQLHTCPQLGWAGLFALSLGSLLFKTQQCPTFNYNRSLEFPLNIKIKGKLKFLLDMFLKNFDISVKFDGNSNCMG